MKKTTELQAWLARLKFTPHSYLQIGGVDMVIPITEQPDGSLHIDLSGQLMGRITGTVVLVIPSRPKP